MPDIKIITEVAGRVCALPVTTGGNVGNGDEIAFVEAMKMEIPVTSTTAGRWKAPGLTAAKGPERSSMRNCHRLHHRRR